MLMTSPPCLGAANSDTIETRRSTKQTSDMANIDKLFYQQAAQELAQGRLDQALWIKVRAENPHSDDPAVQAHYVQARAAELASERGRDTLKRIGTSAIAKTNQTINDVRDGIRLLLKLSLIYVPALGLIFMLISAWDIHVDEQTNFQAFGARIEALDQAAAQKNISNYQEAVSNAMKSCNEMADISKKAPNFFGNADEEAEAQKRCDRLAFIVFDFNHHLAEINQEQSEGDLHFQLKTIEKP